jgi:hypothetical protein
MKFVLHFHRHLWLIDLEVVSASLSLALKNEGPAQNMPSIHPFHDGTGYVSERKPNFALKPPHTFVDVHL